MFSLSLLCLFASLNALVRAQGSELLKLYAPTIGSKCPDITQNPLLREFTTGTQALHPNESAYIDTRESTVISKAWQDWLGTGEQIGYNVSVLSSNFSRVGIAFSGGGYRAAQYSAGVTSALDARDQSAKSVGTGGLLQVASYISGLSGGSWFTGSLYFNDFVTIPDLVYGDGNDRNGWLLDLELFLPGGFDVFDDKNTFFFQSVLASVVAKASTGIDTSITDVWSRMLSYHFFNQTTRANFFTDDTSHGAGQLWSNLPRSSMFQGFNVPVPLIVFDSRPSGTKTNGYTPLDVPVYEVSPFEMGSWDPNVSAMVNLTYVGTHLSNGKPDNDTACVTGFDEAGFIIGTSSSLFSIILDKGQTTLSGLKEQDSAGLDHLVSMFLNSIETRADDVANWPSPFNGVKSNTYIDTNTSWLELIDGGLNLENIPLGPLLVNSRNVDFILAVDGSADTSDSWPNGTSPINTNLRLNTILSSSHQKLPPIPATPNDFVSMGLNLRPTLFGCDPTSTSNPEYPLVLYLPNAPPLTGAKPVTNTDTFKLSYSSRHTHLFLDQVHTNTIGGFKPNTNSPDPDWPKCLQCAAVDRGRMKLSPVVPRSEFCTTCFKKYCYDPANPSSVSQLPNRVLKFQDPDGSFFQQHKAAIIGGSVGGALFFLIVFGACCFFSKKARKNRKRGKYTRVASDHETHPLTMSK
ncbi:phospholipase B [Thelephora terrestris]|uniref:Lysophospholipase n=1 Tax=Thelephora terrestris TaxID=56493 RepID=A0A9P6L4Y2_9AGAM|nr:phospholipase B [Thelephora terrestris]